MRLHQIRLGSAHLRPAGGAVAALGLLAAVALPAPGRAATLPQPSMSVHAAAQRTARPRILGLRAKPLRGDVRFSFGLSKAATVRVRLYLRGKLRARASKRLHAGRRSITVRRLHPGRYRAILVATDSAGTKSRPVRARFTVRRIQFRAANQPPTAVATATHTSGDAPLTVSFDGTGSSDPDPGDRLSYAWDLDGDGAYDDSSSPQPTYTYTSPGSYTASLKVTDSHGATATTAVTISARNTAPTATVIAPATSRSWAVGDHIDFAGSATDPQDGPLPASALHWELILHHCPSNCHTHSLQTWDGVASSSFDAPDHEYPSYLELRLTATDSGGLTDSKSVRLDPRTVDLTLDSSPPGLQLVLNVASAQAPFTRTVIAGSTNSLSAPSPQTPTGSPLYFASWSDGGAESHNITASVTAAYTATYSAASQAPTTAAAATRASGDAR
jgi:PKD repeat protein